jgi:glutaconyl-CoA/methylmalonyl-CoA decarboxylase subunit gamma
MKKFLIKVNGNQYEVEVEEIRDGVLPVPSAVSSAHPVQAPAVAPVQSQTAAPAAVEKKAVITGAVGATKITSPMPGTILKVVANAGDSIKRGQVLVILEAMKMENEIVAPSDGTVASINVSKGASVNAGDLLASLN